MCYCSMGIGPIHLLDIMYFFIIILTPRCPNVWFFYGPIVPEINYSILIYSIIFGGSHITPRKTTICTPICFNYIWERCCVFLQLAAQSSRTQDHQLRSSNLGHLRGNVLAEQLRFTFIRLFLRHIALLFGYINKCRSFDVSILYNYKGNSPVMVTNCKFIFKLLWCWNYWP